MQNSFILSEFLTFIIGLVVLIAGELMCKYIKILARLSIPAPVVGGLMMAFLISSIELLFETKIEFATQLRDILILLFFVSLGFTAKLSELRLGGKPLVLICLVTILLLVLQNVVGISVAIFNGVHPFYGLLAGSVSFVGGPGTALAWASEASAMGLKNAELVAISAATFAVAIGAIVSGPIVTLIIKRHRLESKSDQSQSNTSEEQKVQKAAGTSLIIRTMLIISIAVLIGNQLNQYAKTQDILLPGFLCALLAGMLFINIADARKIKMPTQVIEKVGDVSLQLFLVISLMSLKLSAIGAIILPLASAVILQVCLSIAIAYFILFRVLGKDYNAAVTVGGFLGFSISSMPIAMSTMDQITNRFGPAPKAILLITLAGSFFVDLANAFIVKGFAALLPAITP